MRGIAERDRRLMERDVALAWWIENLNGAGAKLKPLRHYIDQLRPRKPQTAEEILSVFREHEARGAPVKIREIEPGELNDG